MSAHGAAGVSKTAVLFAVLGSLIGSISLTGSLIAWAKLDGRMDKRFVFPGQQLFNLAVFIGALVLAAMSVLWLQQPVIIGFLHPGAGGRLADDAADRRCRHAGGDFPVQRADRPCGGV